MNWFQRHLNLSLFFAVILIPFVVIIIFSIVVSLVVGAYVATTIAGDVASESPSQFLPLLFSTMLPVVIVGLVVGLGLLVWTFVAISWYLGRKARSKGFIMLIFGPWMVSIFLTVLNAAFIGNIVGILGFLAGLIILFLLKNRSVGRGGDFAYKSATAGWSGGGYGGPESRQINEPDYTKELDYTPSQNVLDIAGGLPARDVRSTGDVPDTGGDETSGSVSEEAPPEKVPQRPVTYKRPSMPILLGDDGNVISCAYHPGADAVNLCSRCHQYVCVECNYITGTHPICRNCWERRTEAPLSPPQKQAKPAPSKPAEKQEMEEPAVPVKQEEPVPAEPEASPVAGVTEPVEQIAAEPVEQIPAEPAEQIAEPVKPVEQEAVAPSELEEPPATAVAKPEERPDISAVKPEEQKPAVPIGPAKPDAETSRWQQEFMSIYQQASPIINVIIRKGDDGMPGSPLDLMEGLKLRPMLALVKKLSKPKDRELREAKSELEQVLSSCVKIADSAADFVGGGGHALLGGPDFKRIVEGIEKAGVLMEKLSQRLPAFSRPQE
jgi:hypothetical protein